MTLHELNSYLRDNCLSLSALYRNDSWEVTLSTPGDSWFYQRYCSDGGNPLEEAIHGAITAFRRTMQARKGKAP